ncbi:hypothetical protein LXD69_09640 [Flavobacterium sediminilitoris]|uniref:Uncharacterized protein n=1 Tax=Flavobacterium sediminilitoris TaxID=2024526 RepID=A0ABY4HKC9_9FLAO|nr:MULTISPECIES: hypothetical protein [Flavobacterium]UOX32314.1 hypothetical protein LXD69_09640 [Flavobacterium sediminilitoris]
MKQATILKNGDVVTTENIVQLHFYSSGHLASFKTKDTNIVFHHFVDFDGIEEGYYEKEKYLDYKAEIIKDKSKIIKFKDWDYANYGDEIVLKKRVVSYVGQDLISNNTYCWNEYKLLYSESHFFTNDEINIAIFAINPSNSFCNFNSITQTGAITLTAYNFFVNNIINSNIDDFELINTIANITQMINNIDEEIYEAFSSTDFDDSLKQHQKDKWELSLIINPTDYQAIRNYYTGYYADLKNYYSSVSNYLNYISDGSDIIKAIALASSLHPITLQQIDVNKKIEMLHFIADEFLIVDDIIEHNSAFYDTNGKRGYLSETAIQNFIVNLTYSFGSNDLQVDQSGESAVDYFLQELLKDKKDGIIFKESITLYEVIYKNLNQSYNITEGIVGITNWVFETNYKPNNTRGAFVQGLYFLWQFSRFNPYNENDEIKPGTLGFKILDDSENSIAKFYIDDDDLGNIGCLFYYTSEIGYETYKVTESLTIGDVQEFTLYKQKYENASPIVLPYESHKLFGIFNDNFNFNFEGKKIIATQNKPTDTNYNNDWNSNYRTYSNLIYGVYDLYQPVTIVNTDIDTKSPLLTTSTNETQIINGQAINSLIPVFVLKYIDDAGDQSDAENMLGYLIDGILTFSGIGNLTKLKHLRWAALAEGQIGLFTKQGLRVVFGGIEFSSGVIGFFANFVSCDPPNVPEDSTNPDDIEAWENYRFCKSMKTFITVFQFATLSITVGDTITSLALKKQAARVIKNAGGGVDEVAIKNNLQNRLENVSPNATNLDEVAEVMTETGKAKYLNAAADLLIKIDKIYDKIQPKILNRISNGNGVFNKKFFNLNFDENNLKIIIQDFIQNGINDQKIIEDFVIFACRVDQKIIDPVTGQLVGKIIKGYTFTESRIIINYYANVILKRGFVTGFYNLQDYKLFSQKAKVFLDDFCKKRGISNAKYEVQGSVQFKSHDLDPNVNDVPVLTRDGNIIKPDDFDGRIYISKHQANIYLKGLERDYRKQLRLENPTWNSKNIEKEVNTILINVKKGIKKGMIRKDYIKPDGFLDDLKQAVKRDDGTHIFYIKNSADETEIGFSIIIKGSPYDVDPVMSLKY